MKIDLPGLLREKLPSGNVRYRVRVERRKTKRIRLYVEPGDQDFMEHYRAARRGILMKRPKTAKLTKPRQMRGSLNWLMKEYLGWLDKQVAAGQYSPATLKQRRSQFRHLKPVGEYSLDIPQPELLKLRDSMASTPGATDNFIKRAVQSRRSQGRWPSTGAKWLLATLDHGSPRSHRSQDERGLH